jgi:hypothetical protein
MLTSKLLHDLLDYAEDNLALVKHAMAEQRRLGELSRPGQRDVHDYDEDEEGALAGMQVLTTAPLPTGTKIAALAGIARHHHGGPLRAVVGATRDGQPRSAPRGSCPAAASAALSAQDGANPAGAYDTPVVHTSAALEFRHTYYEIALRKRDELRAAQARRRKRLAAAAMGTGDGDDDGDDGDDDGDDDDDDVIVGDGGGGGGVVASAVTADEAGGLSEPPDAVLSASASGYVGTLAFEQPLPMPQSSSRECHVHSCVLTERDHECLHSRSCEWPLGHLRPVGEQFVAPRKVREWRVKSGGGGGGGGGGGSEDDVSDEEDDVSDEEDDEEGVVVASLEPELSPGAFWRQHVGAYKPVIVRGGARAAMGAQPWDDAFLIEHCTLADGKPWYANDFLMIS